MIKWPFCRKGGQKRWSLVCLFGYFFFKSCWHREQCWQYPLKQSKCRGAFKTKLLLAVTAALLSSWDGLLLLLLLLFYFSAVLLLLKVIDCFPQSELRSFPQHCLQLLFVPVFFVQVCTSTWFHFNLHLLLWTACAASAVAGMWDSGRSSRAFLSIFFQPI